MRQPLPGLNAMQPCVNVFVWSGPMAGQYVGEQAHQEVIFFERSQLGQNSYQCFAFVVDSRFATIATIPFTNSWHCLCRGAWLH